MNTSMSWIKMYVPDLDVTAQEYTDAMTLSGTKVEGFEKLDAELETAKSRNELSLIEVKCSIGARDDLGRPTTTALENKQNFMRYLLKLN